MKEPRIELLEYVTNDGHNPFRTWLLSLRDRQAKAKIRVRLNRVRLGNFGDAKGVGKGVQELRIPYGPGYRVYYAKEGDQVVLLLLGGNKKRQSADIALAQRYWQDYLSRH